MHGRSVVGVDRSDGWTVRARTSTPQTSKPPEQAWRRKRGARIGGHLHAQPANDSRAGTRPSSPLRSFDPFRALRAIRESLTLRSTLRLVALTLISHANASGECWPGYATLGRETGLDRRTAISAVAALSKAGVIEKVRRRTSKGDDDTNLYRLQIGLPARPATPAPQEAGDATTELSLIHI